MSIVGDIQSIVGTVSTLTGAHPQDGWRSKLQQASWRGVPFQTLGGQLRVGRRNAVHEYPFRDTIWVEDLGRSARRISVVGFLVGDNVIEQRERMIAACEEKGNGDLVHMTLGRLKVSLLDTTMEERWDKGRVFEIVFTFVEAGERVFPNNVTSTADVVMGTCLKADFSVSADFVTRVSDSLKQGSAVVGQAVTTAATWSRTAQILANDATNLIHMVGSLPGTFSRYFGGRNKGFSGLTSGIQGASTNVQQLIAIGTVSRNNVVTAANALTSAASGIGL
jgi:prophage DNA circulation protein